MADQNPAGPVSGRRGGIPGGRPPGASTADRTSPLWADQAFLRDVQYRDDGNLAARQSIYAYSEPRRDLAALVLDSLDLAGTETMVDVGCGNGMYPAELARRGHRGPVAGIDMSPGMLAAARLGAPAARLAAGDAAALPLRTAVSDVTLAMHMLYHVPEPERAVAELRRITAPGGRLTVGLNAAVHLAELRGPVNAELALAGYPPDHVVRERVLLDEGADLLARYFGSVIRHDLPGTLLLPGPEPVTAYLRSMSIIPAGPEQERLAGAVIARLDFAGGGLRVTTHAGWLICS